MLLSDDDIRKIAAYESAAPGFDLEASTVASYVQPIIDCIRQEPHFDVRKIQDGGNDGLANYYEFIVYDRETLPPPSAGRVNVDCIDVRLSLLAPVAVFGRSLFYDVKTTFSCHGLELADVCDPALPFDWISQKVIECTRHSAYTLVGRELVSRPLPDGVKVYEYCFGREPWDRYFHALFSNTD